MAFDAQPEICLDVAIDHRLRRLFKSISLNLAQHSNHISGIEARGRSLSRPPEEIRVTAQIAGPARKGGIAVALQQPRHHHPFDKGLDAVIKTCETLRALNDVLTVVSCGTLDIRTNVTVIDLLPYVSKSVAEIDDTMLRESFRISVQAIYDKEPEILLCAGRIPLERAGKVDDRKGDGWKLESVGVGKNFGSAYNLPITARIRCEGRGLVAIRRVNGFHPSYAMNYCPHISLLRQLQILVGTQTCSMFRGDWKEEEWMDELRRHCRGISNLYRDDSAPKYIPYYQERYYDTLSDLQKHAISLILDPRLAENSLEVLYQILLSSGLSKICNDATLILDQMNRLQDEGWPDFYTWKNESALEEAATDTLQVAEDLLEATKQRNNTPLMNIIRRGARSLINALEHYEHELNLTGASKAFLKFATDIENLLADLLQKKEEALRISGQEELSDMMSKLNVAL